MAIDAMKTQKQIKAELAERYEKDENFRKCIDHPDLSQGFPLEFRLEFWAAKSLGFKGSLLDYGVLYPLGEGLPTIYSIVQ